MIFENNVVKAVFKPANGGFPSQVYVKHHLGETAALGNGGASLKIELSDGRTAAPFLPDDFTPTKFSIEGAKRIQFDGIKELE